MMRTSLEISERSSSPAGRSGAGAVFDRGVPDRALGGRPDDDDVRPVALTAAGILPTAGLSRSPRAPHPQTSPLRTPRGWARSVNERK